MHMSKRKHGKLNPIVKTVLTGVFCGIVSAVVMLIISAFILVKNDINPLYVKYFWVVIFFIVGIVCGLSAGRVAKSKGFLWGLITALADAVLLFTVCVIMTDFSINMMAVILIPVCALSGMFSGIISSNL